ncbi:MAG: tetratricopeptide repeat protein [Candidatus Sericytochromatia bacterium]
MSSPDLPTIRQALSRKNWQQALKLCESFLAAHPGHAEGLYCKGLAAELAGRPKVALHFLQRALEIKPKAAWHLALAKLLMENQGYAEALIQIQAALALNPELQPALFQLGRTYLELGQPQQAADCFERLLQHDPQHRAARFNLGLAAEAAGDREKARAIFTELTNAHADAAKAHQRLARLALNEGRPKEAEAHLRAALRLKDPQIHLELAGILHARGDTAAALKQCLRALALDDDLLPALELQLQLLRALGQDEAAHIAANRLARQLQALDQEEAALALNQAMLEADPEHGPSWFMRSSLLLASGHLAEAEAAMTESIRLRPDHRPSYHNRGMIRFGLGKLTSGFSDYEWRLGLPEIAEHPAMRLPRWQRRDLGGERLLVFAEPGKGFGDTLMFARYLPLLQYYHARVVLACQRPLAPLMAAMPGVEVIGNDGPFPDCVAQIPLISLAHVFLSSDETLPDELPYLRVPPDRRGLPLPGAGANFRIGFVWASARTDDHPFAYALYQRKTCGIEAFAPLLEIDGIDWYSFQVGPHALDLQPLLESPKRLFDLAPLLGDFADTAACLEQMDLVICVDTAVAHLAAALGKKVWMLLHAQPYWFWQADRETTAWYPGMKLIRQARPGDWDGVMARVATGIKELLTARRPAALSQTKGRV